MQQHWASGHTISNKKTSPGIIFSLSVPHPRRLRPSNFPLQLKNPLKQRLRSRWTYINQFNPHSKTLLHTARHINIHGQNPIAPSHNTITPMIIPPSISTTPHTHHPPRLRHLIIQQPQRRRHLVSQRTCYD
jgi:hypothetical protein